MKVKYIVYTILAVGMGWLIIHRITSNNDKGADKEAGKSKKAAMVSGIVLKPQPFTDNLSLSGSLEANEQIDVRSEVSGIVESINFEEGAMVRQGQVLLKVNDVELRAQLAKMGSAQQLASENERRAKLLLEKEAISKEEYDISNADLRSAKAESQLINAQLGKTSVRAPFAGKVGLRYISKGTYVTSETPIARLVNTTQLKLTFSIPEKYALQMKPGTTFTFTVAGSKEKFQGKIYAVEPEVEVATRTLKLRAIADNREGKLLPGTFANVDLPLEKIEDALMVPSQALIPIQNGKKVFISLGGKAKEVVVETGSRTDKDVLVTSGLKAGDTVLTTGVMSLKNDSPVKVKIVAQESKSISQNTPSEKQGGKT